MKKNRKKRNIIPFSKGSMSIFDSKGNSIKRVLYLDKSKSSMFIKFKNKIILVGNMLGPIGSDCRLTAINKSVKFPKANYKKRYRKGDLK